MRSLNHLKTRFSTLDISPSRQALLATACVGLILLITWWQVGVWYQAQLLAEQRSAVVEEVSLRETALSLAVHRRVALLRGLYAFVLAEPIESHFNGKFNTYAAELYAGSQDVDYLAIAPNGVIQYIYPPEKTDLYLNHDLVHDTRLNVRSDVNRAIRLRLATVTTPYEFLDGTVGIASRLAVFQNDHFWGLVTVNINLGMLLEEAGLTVPSDTLDFALRGGDGVVFFGSHTIFEQDPVIRRVELPDSSWELASVPRNGWHASVQPQMLAFRLGGLALIGLLIGLTYLSVNRQGQLQQAVDQRTRQIAHINTLLEDRVAKRTQELATLLKVSNNVASTLELRPLLELILDQLQIVVDFTAASLFVLGPDGSLLMRGYRGPLSPTDVPVRWELGKDGPHYEVLHTRSPVSIKDIGGDSLHASQWRDLVKRHLGSHPDRTAAWLGVPLLVKDEVIGMLGLEHHQADYYTESHIELALAFAHQAAVAIENARLYGEAQQAAALKERQKLARELHDSVSQAVYGIALSARTAQTLLTRDPQKAAKPLDYVLSLAEAALTEMRALIFELRPESLESEGLVAALVQQGEVLRIRHELEVTTALPDDEPSIRFEAKQMLYRVAQEALNNVVKHARASHVVIRLNAANGSLQLEIADNGQGFDAQSSYPGHFGLVTMRERAERLNGSISIESLPGEGTRVFAKVPVQPHE